MVPTPLGRPKVDFYLGHLRVNTRALLSAGARWSLDLRGYKHVYQIHMAIIYIDRYSNARWGLMINPLTIVKINVTKDTLIPIANCGWEAVDQFGLA